MPRHIPLVGVETEPRINEWVDNVIMFSAPFCSVLFCSCAFFVQALIMPAIHALHILFFIIDTLLSHVILNIVNEMSYIFLYFSLRRDEKAAGKKNIKMDSMMKPVEQSIRDWRLLYQFRGEKNSKHLAWFLFRFFPHSYSLSLTFRFANGKTVSIQWKMMSFVAAYSMTEITAHFRFE